GGAELVVALRLGESSGHEPLVALAIVDGGKVVSRREGWKDVTGLPFDKAVAGACESWSAAAKREALGSAEGVRLSLACTAGEDYRSGNEIAVLLRGALAEVRDVGALSRVWAGAADALRSQMDSCTSSRTVSFRLAGDKTLERTVAEETRWTEQDLDAELKK